MIDGVEIAAAVRAMPGERACGDRAVYWRDEDVLLVAVIDGLGHGPHAATAAEAAVAYVAEHRAESLEQIVTGCDRALRGTRGVVMTLLRLRESTGECWHLGVGNVEARIIGADAPLLTSPGVVGARLRQVRLRSFVLARGVTVILYTDGISSRFPIRELQGRGAEAIVRVLLTEHAKDHDDAGCAVLVT
ncbi:MAG: protein phosphatase 2C domain-containing protein [Myxococcales bacterium]|nr:protein phosphatase 2C domain-containing protein [Myxococcales bacterium]MCB9706638.1 protein phosphatase 2C domain-containing protein [Myxococcales bacterium]